MAKWEVQIPVVGYVVKYIEADSEEEAIQKALQEDIGEDYEEFGMVEKLCEGNVVNAPLFQAAAINLDESPDD